MGKTEPRVVLKTDDAIQINTYENFENDHGPYIIHKSKNQNNNLLIIKHQR